MMIAVNTDGTRRDGGTTMIEVGSGDTKDGNF